MVSESKGRSIWVCYEPVLWYLAMFDDMSTTQVKNLLSSSSQEGYLRSFKLQWGRPACHLLGEMRGYAIGVMEEFIDIGFVYPFK
ncbi:hypothetical protein OIU78_023290 [Salix suchowensis]|nr:hypothetical protein OIU78_023290 [Salix suchowensis]